MNTEKMANNIARWLRDYCNGYGKAGYVVGLSGGVDSATAAALAVRAVGADRVAGVLMPCRSNEDDLRLGTAVAKWLGIHHFTLDLAPVYDSLTYLQQAIAVTPETKPHICMAEANLKPRLRMIALYYIANVADRLVLGTGNKSELELGYFTKYGDGGVDVLPLGNLYKTQVWELAEYLGVPQEIIDRPPSAGLWAGQTDEGELGHTYAELDGVLAEMALYPSPPGMPTEGIYHRVATMCANAAHKLSMPPMGPGVSL